MMRNSLVLTLLFCFLTPILFAQEDTKAPEPNTKASGRVEAAGTVLDEIESAPDQRIPEEVLGPLFAWAMRFIDEFSADILAADRQWRTPPPPSAAVTPRLRSG